ncbi:MAG: polysaccharide biosynthesis/export family protein [Janthinobacterium lividum]
MKMQLRRQFGCFSLAVVLCGVQHAQTVNSGRATTAQTPDSGNQGSSQSSKIGVGDQLLISVADLEEVTSRAVRVAEDGTVDLPLIGAVQASGSSLPVLRAVLANSFSKYITNPQVSIQLVSSQNQLVSVIGDVNTPSVQELTGPLTLLAAITRAGGAKPDAGPQVIVTREARWGVLPLPGVTSEPGSAFSRASLSLDDLVAEKSPQNNILLRPGDVISIPKGSIIYVVGDVHRSGGFPLRSGGSLSVIEAIALAEGLAPNAKSQNAKILRPSSVKGEKRQEIPVDISKVLSGKQADPQLFADDILFVPNSAAKSGARRAAEAILQVSTGILIYR